MRPFSAVQYVYSSGHLMRQSERLRLGGPDADAWFICAADGTEERIKATPSARRLQFKNG